MRGIFWWNPVKYKNLPVQYFGRNSIPFFMSHLFKIYLIFVTESELLLPTSNLKNLVPEIKVEHNRVKLYLREHGILLPKLFWPTVRKIVLVIEKNFWNSRLKAENLQISWDCLNNLFKQWKVRTISGNRMFF